VSDGCNKASRIARIGSPDLDVTHPAIGSYPQFPRGTDPFVGPDRPFLGIRQDLVSASERSAAQPPGDLMGMPRLARVCFAELETDCRGRFKSEYSDPSMPNTSSRRLPPTEAAPPA
jgi:hypothetical protein